MTFFKINREERHFGFLFLTAVISNPNFRDSIFSLMNSRFAIALRSNDFDVYTEVAVLRDHWFTLGPQKRYDQRIHDRRLAVLCNILNSMGLDPAMVDDEDMFWTGAIGNSKLWYPGKWVGTRIGRLEEKRGIPEKRLWRCRWLCNAKPDVMICSGNDVLLIEIKVESGMGAGDKGYDQPQTQDDIIHVGQSVVEWMREARIKRITLTHIPDPNGLCWDEITAAYKATRNSHDAGAAMIERHFAHIPPRRTE
jgi:hypothetical protein